MWAHIDHLTVFMLVIILTLKQGQSSLKPRWNLIEEAYQKLIYTSLELEKSILSYNSRYDQIWSFQGLHTLVNKVLIF